MARLFLPKKTEEDARKRSAAIQDATRYAIEIPLKVMKTSIQCFEIIRAMAGTGNPNSLSDAGVGALALPVRNCRSAFKC